MKKSATEKAENLLDAGKAKATEAMKNPNVKEAADKIKDIGSGVLEGAAKITDSAEDFISEKLGLNEEE